MRQLTNKRILLGVTGSVAAYKAGELIRELRRAGAEVRVVLTRSAAEFVTPLTFQALSGHPVNAELLDAETEAGMGHIELARWADCILVAPASADFLARLAQGRADDLLTAVCLARGVPLAVTPAMNQKMWANAATQANLDAMRGRGVLIFGPDSGEQACGETGPGRMLEVPAITEAVSELFTTGSLQGRTVLVTAGPTREVIDPVRFLANHSSGKMGFSIAEAAQEAGARVILVSGPVNLPTPDRVERIDVISAEQMLAEVQERVVSADILVAAAAVADYRPVQVATEKIRKTHDRLQLELVRNPDILREVKRAHPRLFCLGFAAETEDLHAHARAKLIDKGIEMIAANRVGAAAEDAEGVFGSDTNALSLLWGEDCVELPLAPKAKLARQLIASLAQRFDDWSKRTNGRGDNIVTLPGNRN